MRRRRKCEWWESWNKRCRRKRRNERGSKKMGEEKKSMFSEEKNKKKQKTGHLARWNYISDAHTTLTLLSHQHMALAEMVYVHVCACMCWCVCTCVCGWLLKELKVRFRPWNFCWNPAPFTLIGHCIKPKLCLIYNTIERVRCPCPEKPVQTVQREGKKELRGLVVPNAHNYHLT